MFIGAGIAVAGLSLLVLRRGHSRVLVRTAWMLIAVGTVAAAYFFVGA